MEVISLRLRELEAEEIRICEDHKALLKKRAQEDELSVDQRAKEDEAWKSRLEIHDREEDNLRQQRRALSRAVLSRSASLAENGYEGDKPSTWLPLCSSNKPDENKANGTSDGVLDLQRAQEPTAVGRILREKKPRKSNLSGKSFPHGYDCRGRPLYIRPSDGKLVYLECCVPGCGKTNFKSISSLMRHTSDMRKHSIGKGFFKNHPHAIEVCGRIAPKHEEYVEEAADYFLPRSRRYRVQTESEAECSIPISSLRQRSEVERLATDEAAQQNDVTEEREGLLFLSLDPDARANDHDLANLLTPSTSIRSQDVFIKPEHPGHSDTFLSASRGVSFESGNQGLGTSYLSGSENFIQSQPAKPPTHSKDTGSADHSRHLKRTMAASTAKWMTSPTISPLMSFDPHKNRTSDLAYQGPIFQQFDPININNSEFPSKLNTFSQSDLPNIEIERVQLPDYVCSMSYKSDSDRYNAAPHNTPVQETTSKQREDHGLQSKCQPELKHKNVEPSPERHDSYECENVNERLNWPNTTNATMVCEEAKEEILQKVAESGTPLFLTIQRKAGSEPPFRSATLNDEIPTSGLRISSFAADKRASSTSPAFLSCYSQKPKRIKRNRSFIP